MHVVQRGGGSDGGRGGDGRREAVSHVVVLLGT